MRIGVDCRFSENGTVQVKKIKQGERWVSVGQGRQWQDVNGRHVLIMLPNEEVWEIIMRPDTLIWEKGAGRIDSKNKLI